MNAAIRAVTRITALEGIRVLGFRRGWEGLITNTFIELTPRSVSGIIQLGGTILHTHRTPEFEKLRGVKKAALTLKSNKVDALVVIGGDGSFKGACELSKETDALIVGIPATIDNDVFGTDETIGFDTAVNTAVEEIDKIRDTAISHERIFIVEVMGRERGFIALTVGLTVGAEIVLIPEQRYPNRDVFSILRENSAKGKKSGIIVAAEGVGDTRELAKDIERNIGVEARVSILGYAQRGGSPTARSRLLANLFANEAIKLLVDEQSNRVVGLQKGQITSISLEESCKSKKPLDPDLLKLASTLAT
jgi:6-phosphofructokinase 1